MTSRKLGSNRIVFLCLLLGAIFRLVQFVANRSIWMDEAHLANAIVDGNFWSQIPKQYFQTAPLSIAILMRLCWQAFGDSELSLRLLPLVASLLSLFLFPKLARCYFSGRSLVFVVALFAFCEPFVYYASELKQYSTDILFSLLLLISFVRSPTILCDSRRLVIWVLLGAVSILFSHPAIFTFSALTFCALSDAIRARDRKSIERFIVLLEATLLVSIVAYYSTYRVLDGLSEVRARWERVHAFPPLLPTNIGELKRFVLAWTRFFEEPFTTPPSILWGVLLILGLIYIDGKRRLIFFFPIVLAFFSAGLKVYPFQSRLLIFFLPSSLILITFGFEHISRYLPRVSRYQLTLVLIPFSIALYKSYPARTREELRPLLNELKKRIQSDDHLFVHWASRPAFQYYQRKVKLPNNVTLGEWHKGDESGHLKNIAPTLGHSRVWYLYSHVDWKRDKIALDSLALVGKEISRIEFPGALAILFEFRAPQNYSWSARDWVANP